MKTELKFMDAEQTEKIEQLLNSGTAENNYLAMQLMLNVLQYSFEKAYDRLIPQSRNEESVILPIAGIKIFYKVDLQRIIYASSSYADIERSIFLNAELLPESTRRLYADDDSVLSLGEYGTVDQLPEIKDDIKNLCPLIKDLWFKNLL